MILLPMADQIIFIENQSISSIKQNNSPLFPVHIELGQALNYVSILFLIPVCKSSGMPEVRTSTVSRELLFPINWSAHVPPFNWVELGKRGRVE